MCISVSLSGQFKDITILTAKFITYKIQQVQEDTFEIGITGNSDRVLRGSGVSQPSFTASRYRIDVIFIPSGSVLGKRRRLSFKKGYALHTTKKNKKVLL
ncbi:hypothetical protein CAJAP_10111 [Camponotus japonicus]